MPFKIINVELNRCVIYQEWNGAVCPFLDSKKWNTIFGTLLKVNASPKIKLSLEYGQGRICVPADPVWGGPHSERGPKGKKVQTKV